MFEENIAYYSEYHGETSCWQRHAVGMLFLSQHRESL